MIQVPIGFIFRHRIGRPSCLIPIHIRITVAHRLLNLCFATRPSSNGGVEPCKLPVQRDVVKRFFHRRVGVAEELLRQVNTQHHFGDKGRAPRGVCSHIRRHQG